MENEFDFPRDFFDINSPIFGETNVHKIYQEAKKKTTLEPASIASIKELQSRVEAISKMRERRQLKGLRRKISNRSWLSWAPRHLIVSDLAYVRRLNVPIGEKISHRTLFLAMDHFSRYPNLTFTQHFPPPPSLNTL